MWHVWGRRAAFRAWMGEPVGKRPLEENIDEDGREIGWDGADWIRLASDRDLSGSCESGNEPSGSI